MIFYNSAGRRFRKRRQDPDADLLVRNPRSHKRKSADLRLRKFPRRFARELGPDGVFAVPVRRDDNPGTERLNDDVPESGGLFDNRAYSRHVKRDAGNVSLRQIEYVFFRAAYGFAAGFLSRIFNLLQIVRIVVMMILKFEFAEYGRAACDDRISKAVRIADRGKNYQREGRHVFPDGNEPPSIPSLPGGISQSRIKYALFRNPVGDPLFQTPQSLRRRLIRFGNDDGVGPRQRTGEFAQNAVGQGRSIAERTGGVDKNDIDVTDHPAMLKRVVGDDDIDVVIQKRRHVRHAVARNRHRYVRQPRREQKRFVSDDASVAVAVQNDDRRGRCAAVASADDPRLQAPAGQLLGDEFDERRFVGPAGREIPDADDRQRRFFRSVDAMIVKRPPCSDDDGAQPSQRFQNHPRRHGLLSVGIGKIGLREKVHGRPAPY